MTVIMGLIFLKKIRCLMLSIHRIRSNIEPDNHRSAVAFPDFLQLKMN